MRRGADAIKHELATQLKAVGGTQVKVPEAYDLKSMMDQIEAAGL